MTERMGFETNRRFVKEYNNQRITAEVGGKEYHFRSKLEYKWAQYLELLKKGKEIKGWDYENTTFRFPDDKWLVDFCVRNNDDTFYYVECKGHFEARDRRKLKLINKYRPEVVVHMVFYSVRDAKRIGQSRRFVEKISIMPKGKIKTIFDKNIDNGWLV